MRIRWQSFTKNGNPYLRTLQNSVQRLAPPGVTVDVAGLERPDITIHRLTEARCAMDVFAANLDAEADGYDAVVIGHFQDGGVYELRSALDIPVVGLGEAAMHQAMMLGDAFGLVTINPGFLSFHRDQVTRYGLGSKLSGVLAMEMTEARFVAAFAGDVAEQEFVARQFGEAARVLTGRGADVVIPAGGLPALLLFESDIVPDLGGAVVIDPIAIALEQAVMLSRLGDRAKPGRVGAFARPNERIVADYLSVYGAGRPQNLKAEEHS